MIWSQTKWNQAAWGPVANNNPPYKAMPESNRISATLLAAAITAINGAIATIRTNLPFLLSLTIDERKALPKLGDGRVALLEDAYPLMLENPDLVPTYVDIAEVTKDHDLRNALDPILNSIGTLFQDVEDTEIIVGSELYNAIRGFYLNCQEAAKRGVATAQAVVNVLSKYFARPGRTPKPPTPHP
jgi:hypothetical protein